MKARRTLPPLVQPKLEEMALRYVGRYATSRAKLRGYLSRKLRERGWEGPREPDLEALANRFVELGYIDDAAYALGKSQGLSSRGYGKRRVAESLKLAGIDEQDGLAAIEHADRKALDAALRFARRRRIGPFAVATGDTRQRDKAVAAMVRAGHSFALARVIADLEAGADLDLEEISDRARLPIV